MQHSTLFAGTTLVVALLGLSPAWAGKVARSKEPATKVTLTDAGVKLEAKYTEQLNRLKAEITAAVPAVDEAGKQEFLAAYRAEVAANVQERKTFLGVGSKDLKDANAKKAATQSHEA